MLLQRPGLPVFSILALVLLIYCSVGAKAQDMPVFKIEFNEGKITPLLLEVPANQPFKIELFNTGKTPVEFESLELRKEKVLGPQTQSFIVIRRLAPGEYKFFDEFHMDFPHAVIRAILK